MEASEDVEMSAPTAGRTVIKRDGSKQEFDRNKILERVKALSYGLHEEYVTFDEVVEKVSIGVFDGTYFTYICSNLI